MDYSKHFDMGASYLYIRECNGCIQFTNCESKQRMVSLKMNSEELAEFSEWLDNNMKNFNRVKKFIYVYESKIKCNILPVENICNIGNLNLNF